MKITGFNLLNFPTGKSVSFYFKAYSKSGENYTIGLSGDKNFSIKFSGNYILDYKNIPIDYLNQDIYTTISGNFYEGEYNDLYYQNQTISLKEAHSYNYIDKLYIDCGTNELDCDLSIKIETPQITLQMPQAYNEYSEIDGTLLISNNSTKIYSSKIIDITPSTLPKRFELSGLSINGGAFKIITTGVNQFEEYRTYNLDFNFETNIGDITKSIVLTGKNSPLSQDITISKIIDISPQSPFESGESLYLISSNFLSGANIIDNRNFNVSFSYYTGITGQRTANIIGSGIHNILYTGAISGSGFLLSNPNSIYNITGYNNLEEAVISGNINFINSGYYIHTGLFSNQINLTGTGLLNSGFSINTDLFLTGTNIVFANGSGVLNGSGFLTGIANNITGSNVSEHLLLNSNYFNELRISSIPRTPVSGIIKTGYVEEFVFFTGINNQSVVDNYLTTGFLTGKNETLFIYSGNNISGLFTGNLTGSGFLDLVPNMSSPTQNFTGYLSGDLSNRSISINLPFSGAYAFEYFTGYNEQDITVSVIGNAFGYDPLNSNTPIIASVTGSKILRTGINYLAVNSGIRYIVLPNNLINETPVSLANYKFTDNFNSSNINASYYINNIFSNRQRTLSAITSSFIFQNGVNNSISFYTGFNNQWTNIWNLYTGYSGPAYNSDPNVFGAKIAFDYSGNNIIVGCDRCDNQYSTSISQGQVLTYARNNNQITTGSRITLGSPYNSYKTKARFGFDIDIDDSGNSLIVGAPSYRYCTGQNNQLIFDCLETNVHPSDLGAAFLYTKQNNSWVLETGFQPTNITGLNSWAQFGHSVAINKSGNLVAITSLAENQNHSGALYIYEKNGNSWNLSHKRSGIYGGGRRVEFDKNSNILVYHNGIPREWGSDWAWVNNGSAIIDSIAMIENKTGFWDNVGSIYTGATSTINNFTITDSSKLVIIHTGQASWMQASPLNYSNIGYQTIRSNGSGGQLMDTYTVPGRAYVLRSGPSINAPTNPIVAQISPATGYRSTFNSSTPFGQWNLIGEARAETPPKFLIYNISGNYETEITGDSNFTTIDTQDSYFVSNDLTNYIAISGNSSNLIQAVRNRDFIKNMRADYSHLGLRATNIAYQAVQNWIPIINFVNLPNTYTLLGTGFISKQITGNLQNLVVNNKSILDLCQANNFSTNKIQEIQEKMFTGIWSGTGFSNKINQNLNFTLNDSGRKNLSLTEYSSPIDFKPVSTTNSSSYATEINPSGLFSGNFSGSIIGTGYMQRQISGIATGSTMAGDIVSGLNFKTGIFSATINGVANNGIHYRNENVFGYSNDGIYLTGFLESCIVTGNVNINEISEITGYLPTNITYNKTLGNSFVDVRTGETDDSTNQSLFFNGVDYTGNLYNYSGNILMLRIMKRKLYDDDILTGVLNIKIYNPDNISSFVTGYAYESV